MPVFISYSHADADKVNHLAAHLVKRNASVWIDKWELNVGDSLIQRIQEAITSANALLVILSEASVASEWCKKELAGGLMRELDEKKVLVLPVLLEDCEIPLFLREKVYADLRGDFESGLADILNAIDCVANPNQSRFKDDVGYTDWAVDWGDVDGLFMLRFTIINSFYEMGMTFLIEVSVLCNEVLTERQQRFQQAGLDWIGRQIIAEGLFEVGQSDDLKLYLEDPRPQTVKIELGDPKTNGSYFIHASCRKVGIDNGKNQHVNIGNYLQQIRDYMKVTSRQPTADERAKLIEILRSPINPST